MPIVVVTINIQAPIGVCFDLARNVEIHLQSTRRTNERVVGGATGRPRSFRDSQVRGAFRRFDHDHLFSFLNGVTTMTDVFDYKSPPLGWLGRAADVLFLETYMRRFLVERQRVIKSIAGK